MLAKSLTQSMRNQWQSWFQSEKLTSELNGEIIVRTFFGYQAVMVDGFYQSGTYINALLRAMLRKVPRTHRVKDVLMLGLGGGGGITVLRKRFPNARITTIEHDPVMVELARRLVFEPQQFTPEIILKDAEAALVTLAGEKKQFDVIVSDLFRGEELSPLLGSEKFLELLHATLAPDGYLAVNLFHHAPRIEKILSAKFSLWSKLRYSYNHMQIYRHFGLGNVGDPAPNYFVSKQQSQLFLASQAKLVKASPVGEEGYRGLRYALGPIALETYTSASRPVLVPWKGLRIAIWSPLMPLKPDSGWFSKLFADSGWQIGITRCTPDYVAHWSPHAQRHLKKWTSADTYQISELSPDEFEKAYHASRKLDSLMRKAFMREVRSHFQISPENTSIKGVTDSTGKVIAGLVTADYLDIGQSCHLVSFIHPDANHTPVGYGLIADWYEHCQQQGITCLNFGVVAKDRDPKAWQGYSQFKRQFGLYLIKYAPDQLKITLQI